MFVSVAHAAGAVQQAGGGSSAIHQIVPIIIIVAVFYFILFRPQMKQAKEHQELLNNLKRGIRIVTKSGLFGTIIDLNEKTVTLEIAKDVKIEMTREAIAAQVDKKGEPVGSGKNDDDKKKNKKKIG